MNDISYVMAGFGVAYLVNGLIHGGILVHVYNLFVKEKLYTREDLKNTLMTKLPHFFHELLHCELCLCLTVAALLTIGRATHPLEIAGAAGLGYTFILMWKAIGKFQVQQAPQNTKEEVGAAIQQLIEADKIQQQGEERVQSYFQRGSTDVPIPPGENIAKVSMCKIKDKEKPRQTLSKLGLNFYKDDGDKDWKFDFADEDKDTYLRWFDDPEPLCGPGITACSRLYGEWLSEVAALEAKAASEGVPCSECSKGSIKNKYYHKIRKWHHASINKKVSRPGEKAGV